MGLRNMTLLIMGILCFLWLSPTRGEEEEERRLMKRSELDSDLPGASLSQSECDFCDSRCKYKCGSRRFRMCCYHFIRRKKNINSLASSQAAENLVRFYLSPPEFDDYADEYKLLR